MFPRPAVLLACFPFVASLPAAALAGPFSQLSREVVASDGGALTDGRLQLAYTIGQPMAQPMAVGSLHAQSGYWAKSTGVVVDAPAAAIATRIHSNSPNPFNPFTTIRFDVGGDATVAATGEIFDLAGRRVRTLLDERLSPGSHELRWDATDDRARSVGSGVYLCRLRAGSHRSAIRMSLVK